MSRTLTNGRDQDEAAPQRSRSRLRLGFAAVCLLLALVLSAIAFIVLALQDPELVRAITVIPLPWFDAGAS